MTQVKTIDDLWKSFGHPQKAQKKSLYLLGCPDDLGVYYVGGKQGARFAPQGIRRALSRYSSGLAQVDSSVLLEKGHDVRIQVDLKENHQAATVELEKILASGNIPVVLGGGHDYVYPQIVATGRHFSKKPVVINLDAHFDCRPKVDGWLTSGSPFHEAIEEGHLDAKDYHVLGIQRGSNAPGLFEYADKKGIHVYMLGERTRFLSVIDQIQKETNLQGRPLILSIDLDVFSESFAPGVSAPQWNGLSPDEAVLMVRQLAMSVGLLSGLGVFETNPPLDRGDQTSRLAAGLIYEYWQALLEPDA